MAYPWCLSWGNKSTCIASIRGGRISLETTTDACRELVALSHRIPYRHPFGYVWLFKSIDCVGYCTGYVTVEIVTHVWLCRPFMLTVGNGLYVGRHGDNERIEPRLSRVPFVSVPLFVGVAVLFAGDLGIYDAGVFPPSELDGLFAASHTERYGYFQTGETTFSNFDGY